MVQVVPATHMEMNLVSRSWLQQPPPVATEGTWGVNQWIGVLYLLLSLSASQIKGGCKNL